MNCESVDLYYISGAAEVDVMSMCWSPDEDDDEDEDISPEAKAQREKVRRQQNNARERYALRCVSNSESFCHIACQLSDEFLLVRINK